MSRPQILAILIGIGLIAFGLLYRGSEQGDAGGAREIVRTEGVEETDAEPPQGGAEGRTGLAHRSSGQPVDAERITEVELEVTVRNERTGAPAAGAVVGLWRASTGSGPAYRSARRLVSPDPRADAEGRISLVAPLAVPIEVIARTADLGPTTLVDIGPLSAADGPVLQVEILVEPPPRRSRSACSTDVASRSRERASTSSTRSAAP